MSEILSTKTDKGKEPSSLVIELGEKEQFVLFVTLHTQLMGSVALEMRSLASEQLRKNHEVLRQMFVNLAEKLKKTKELPLSERIAMGLTDLLTEDELKSETANNFGLHDQARYLLLQMKKTK